MSTDLDTRRNDTPERFVPAEMKGQLAEAEHLSRYRWASGIAAGRRVLDAGCGEAYGSAMLARAGAAAVTGVDIAESVLESARDGLPAEVTLEVGDVRSLPYKDGSFDLIVCFEVIEHVEDPAPVLDELRRLLAPEGVLLISSPNRGVYPPGNEYHLHEFTPGELRTELEERFANVRLMRQHAYVGAAVLSDEEFAGSAEQPFAGGPLYNLAAAQPDQELYTLAIAGGGDLPEVPGLVMLTSHLALNEWIDHIATYEETLRAQRRYIAEMTAIVEDYHLISLSLQKAEAACGEAQEEVAQLKAKHHAEQAELLNSLSWRITQPIRAAKLYFASRRR
jgi:SAM-dependent methyltransferase